MFGEQKFSLCSILFVVIMVHGGNMKQVCAIEFFNTNLQAVLKFCSLIQPSFPVQAILLIYSDQESVTGYLKFRKEIARVCVLRMFLYCRLKSPLEIWLWKEAFFLL